MATPAVKVEIFMFHPGQDFDAIAENFVLVCLCVVSLSPFIKCDRFGSLIRERERERDAVIMNFLTCFDANLSQVCFVW